MLSAHLTSAQSRLGRLSGPLGKISQDFVFAALSQVLGRGSLILASILVANFMTVESFSTFTYFNLTLAMIATFSTLGLSVAASRIFAETTLARDEGKREEAASVLVLALASALLAACALPLLPSTWLAKNIDLGWAVVSASVVALTLHSVLLGALSGRGDFGLMALAATAGLLVLLGGVGVAVRFASVDVAIWSVLVSMVLQICIFSVRIRPCLRSPSDRRTPLVDKRAMTKVLGVAGPTFLTSLLVAALFWLLGRMLLAQENGVTEFSRYAVGLQWFSFILLVPSITTRVFFPHIVRASAQENANGRSLVLTNAGANLLVAAGIGTVALVCGDVLLGLYGNEQVADKHVFQLFVLAAIAAAPVNGLGNAIIAKGSGPSRWLFLQVGWAVIALASALYLTTHVTAASMAWSLLLAYLCLVPASLVVLKQQKLV